MSIEHRHRRYEFRCFNPHIRHKENWHRANELPRKQIKKPGKIRFFPGLCFRFGKGEQRDFP
jgi:hypothetical protein